MSSLMQTNLMRSVRGNLATDFFDDEIQVKFGENLKGKSEPKQHSRKNNKYPM